MLGKIEDRREKGATEDETVGWHHQLGDHEFEQSMGDSEDRVAWRAIVHGIPKSQTSLGD